MNDLKGKCIVIFGAGGLLGSNLVKHLVNLKLNINIIAADINIKSMEKRLISLDVNVKDELLSLEEVDVTKESSVRSFFSQNRSYDGIVNASYPRNKLYGKELFEVTIDSFNENLSLHLGSAFLLMQQASKYFMQRKQNLSLVNISSIYGVVAPKFDIYEGTAMTMPVEYAAIKAAIQHLNKYIVSYIKDSRFRVNSISPGGIYDNQPDEFLVAYKKYTNGMGMLDVVDLMGPIAFLLSDESKYITGQNIVVDDGFSL